MNDDFCQILTPKQKALKINLDNEIYGSFSEIGAGQEVSRHFFKAGAAAGTIAKTMSAYDMLVSDAIYGRDEKDSRYVSRTRVKRMIDREYDLLIDRLDKKRPFDSKFFAFANTVATSGQFSKNISHGWMGIKFQDTISGKPNEVVLHIRMRDNLKSSQMDALGILGVNLIYAAYFENESPYAFVRSLMDGLSSSRIYIDSIEVSGKVFELHDPRIISLELVKKGFTPSIMFDEKGCPIQASDYLYKKNILVLRGSWKPPTLVNFDMLKCGKAQFEKFLGKEESKNLLVLPEISMSKLIERGGQVSNEDFLARIDLVNSLGLKVMITNFDMLQGLTSYIFEMSKKHLAYVLGVYNFERIFKEETYKNSELSLIGGFGKLFNCSPRFFVYPENRDSKLVGLGNLELRADVKNLITYLKDNRLVEEVKNFDKSVMDIWSREVLQLIKDGDERWESMVPKKVAKLVKKSNLFK